MTQIAQHGCTDLRQKRRPLTQTEQTTIWAAVHKKMSSDDKDPTQVILDDYKGKTEAWCWAMVEWHNLWYLLSR